MVINVCSQNLDWVLNTQASEKDISLELNFHYLQNLQRGKLFHKYKIICSSGSENEHIEDSW